MFNIIKGLVIGLGAVAPGLSGSVLLVIFGLYEKTLSAISTTVKSAVGFAGEFFKNIKSLKNLKKSENLKTIINNIKFLVPLFIGIAVGALLFSKLVDFLFATVPMPTRFAFFGFIAGTVPLLFKEMKKEEFNWKYIFPIAIAFAAGIGILILKLNVENAEMAGEITGEVSKDSNFFSSIILGFTVATSYIIPGVDSAAILSALGLYETWVGAIANITESFHILIPAAIGLVIGVLVVSFTISKLIEKCYTFTYSVIFGLFLAIVPAVLIDKSCFDSFGMNTMTVVSLVLMIVGFVLSLLFSNLEKLKDKKAKENE